MSEGWPATRTATLFARAHGWVSYLAVIGAGLSGSLPFTAPRHYSWVEYTAAGAAAVAGVVLAFRSPREWRVVALLVAKGVVVALLLDVSVTATMQRPDPVSAGWLAGAAIGAGLVVLAGGVLESREVAARDDRLEESMRLVSSSSLMTLAPAQSGRSSRRSWLCAGAAAAVIAAIVTAGRRR